MSVIIPNAFHAYGSVRADGTRRCGLGFSARKTLDGVYFIRLDEPVNEAECVCTVTPRGSTAGFAIVEQFSDEEKIVYTLNEGGIATNYDFDFVILRCPGS